jgi:hypothetical protein
MERHIPTYPAGEPSPRPTVDAHGATGAQGLCSTLAWAAASVTAAMVAALIPLLAAGFLLVHDVVDTLTVRAHTLERFGVLPLPSAAELAAIDASFVLGAALVLMGPVAFLVGGWTALARILGEVVRAVGQWPAILIAPPWALLLAGLWSAMHPAAAVLLTATTGVSTFSALSWLRSRRRAAPTSIRLSPGPVVLIALSVAVLVGLTVSGSGGSGRDRLGSLRDRLLLPTAAGRAAATFYYRHTMYAAETYKPTFSNPFTALRRDPGFLRSALTPFPDLPVTALGIAAEVCRPDEAHACLAEQRHDVYLLPDRPEWVAAANRAGIANRAVFISGDTTARDLAARLEAIASEATGLRALTAAGWNAVLFCGPACVLLVVLGIAGAAGLALPRAAPVLIAGGPLLLLVAAAAISAPWMRVGSTDDQHRLATLLRQPEPSLRSAAAARAARVLLETQERHPELYEALAEAVHDDALQVRTWAVLALARHGGQRAIPELIDRLRDDSLLVRYRTAAALRSLHAPSARPHLEERLREDAWYVGMHALAALRSTQAVARSNGDPIAHGRG